jgi:hypothetical protein
MSRQVGRVNQQSKGETPLMSGVLQRAAVRVVADKEVEATEDVESGRLRESRFRHDFSQVGIDRGGLPPIQAKLTIGKPGDKYEQEADRVASQVVQQINAPASVQSSQGQSVQRTEALEEEKIQAKPENISLQRMEAIAGGEASTNLESAISRARGGGQPLDAGLQQSMGQAMGADFSGVKVHTDATSDRLNQSIQAKAFTTGQDVFFRQGAYEPGNRGGQELIAHELTHIVQQNRKENFVQCVRIWSAESGEREEDATPDQEKYYYDEENDIWMLKEHVGQYYDKLLGSDEAESQEHKERYEEPSQEEKPYDIVDIKVLNNNEALVRHKKAANEFEDSDIDFDWGKEDLESIELFGPVHPANHYAVECKVAGVNVMLDLTASGFRMIYDSRPVRDEEGYKSQGMQKLGGKTGKDLIKCFLTIAQKNNYHMDKYDCQSFATDLWNKITDKFVEEDDFFM